MTASSASSAPRSVRESIAVLRAHQMPPRGVSVYSIHVNRPLGRVLAAMAARAGLTPNAVTLLSALSSLLAIVALATLPISVPVGLLAAVLLVLGFALDSADGQLARLRGGGSKAGELLDHGVDLVVKLSLHLAVFLAWWHSGVSGWLLAVPLAFQLASTLLFFLGTLAGILGARPAPTSAQAGALRSWMLLPVDHGVLCLSFLLWGLQPAFTLVYVGLFLVCVLGLVVLGTRWFRELT